MKYQITCVCGNRFFVTEQQLGGHVPCPACNRALIPLTAEANAASTNSPAGDEASGAAPMASAGSAIGAEPTKRCSYCGEVILAIARKCKHCGEYLDRAPAGTVASAPTDPATGVAQEVPAVFELAVSQWDNFWKYIICLTVFVIITAVLLLIPALKDFAAVGVMGTFVLMTFIGWFFYLSVRNSRCIIRPNRIETEVGIFSKQIDSLDIIRVMDLELKQGLLQRVLGVGTILIKSNDTSSPEMVLYMIPQARKVYKYLQDQVPLAQRQRGIFIMDK